MTKKAFADLLEKVKARAFGSNGFEMAKEDTGKLRTKYKDRLQTVTDLGKKQKKARRYRKNQFISQK